MPQTRFVTRKALALGLKPIVVINKIDRPGSRPDWVINETFSLTNWARPMIQIGLPSGLRICIEWLRLSWMTAEREGTMDPLFESILTNVPTREADASAPFQMQVTSTDYSTYVGKIAIGRIARGRVKAGQNVIFMDATLKERRKQVASTEYRNSKALTASWWMKLKQVTSFLLMASKN